MRIAAIIDAVYEFLKTNWGSIRDGALGIGAVAMVCWLVEVLNGFHRELVAIREATAKQLDHLEAIDKALDRIERRAYK